MTLEEVNGVFGDKVAMEMDEITDSAVEKQIMEVKHVDNAV